MIHTGINESFILWECCTFAKTTKLSLIMWPWTLAINPETIWLYACRLLKALNCAVLCNSLFRVQGKIEDASIRPEVNNQARSSWLWLALDLFQLPKFFWHTASWPLAPTYQHTLKEVWELFLRYFCLTSLHSLEDRAPFLKFCRKSGPPIWRPEGMWCHVKTIYFVEK